MFEIYLKCCLCQLCARIRSNDVLPGLEHSFIALSG